MGNINHFEGVFASTIGYCYQSTSQLISQSVPGQTLLALAFCGVFEGLKTGPQEEASRHLHQRRHSGVFTGSGGQVNDEEIGRVVEHLYERLGAGTGAGRRKGNRSRAKKQEHEQGEGTGTGTRTDQE